jgi:hypothetical protein
VRADVRSRIFGDSEREDLLLVLRVTVIRPGGKSSRRLPRLGQRPGECRQIDVTLMRHGFLGKRNAPLCADGVCVNERPIAIRERADVDDATSDSHKQHTNVGRRVVRRA